jgi:competence CoiA-like predicted nuclease
MDFFLQDFCCVVENVLNHERRRIVLFSAVQKDGEVFCLFPRHSRKVLQEKRKNEEFYCPECKERVIMKLGSQRIEHFSHQKDSNCTESYERESDYHINGKLQLYQWLEIQNLSPVLEPYYHSIRQRPDVGFLYHLKSYALEFQCSAIPLELMEKRTKQYRKIQASVLWILGGKHIKQKGERKVALTNFDYYFLSKDPTGFWYLPAYCPASKIFIILHNLSPISTKNAFAHLSIIPIHQFTIESLSFKSKHLPFSSAEWKREIQNQKLNIQMRGFQQYHRLLKELYLSGLNITLLPPFIGLPVPSAVLMESPPLIWQTYFFIDQLLKRKAGEIITFNDIFQGYVKRLERGNLKERPLPLAPNCSHLAPIIEYLEVLEKVQILERLYANTFRIKQKAEIARHIGQHQTLEDLFYHQYEDILFL